MPFTKGHKHSEAWRAAVGKPRPAHVKRAISAAQQGRPHTPQEGFQRGHSAFKGTERTRFIKGQPSWNSGTKGQNVDPAKLKLRTYRANAAKRGIAFEVSLAQMRSFLEGGCTYCGAPSTGIDRIDNLLGYVEGNMAACCGVCNHMKWNLSLEDFINKCALIARRHG